ncbi:MAG: cytochrome C oxidase subunit II [Treponema sp.]|jgi:hypothetical protein|nr:cytochrome C oxidase subunit II [Treponema sp.]
MAIDDSGETPKDGINRLMQEETERVIHHISATLPREIVEHLDLSGNLKEKLFSYFNRNIQALVSSRSSPLEAGQQAALQQAALEKSLSNMYGHFQGHIQRGISELENQTTRLLRQNGESGAFIRSGNAYTVVKCAFRDNPEKPKTVTDLKLCVNVHETDLVSPIFHYQVTMEYLVKDLLSKNIIETIDREVEKLRDERLDQGLEEYSDAEILINKLEKAGEIADDDGARHARSKRYSLIAKEILDRLKDSRAEIDPSEYDQLSVRENLKKILDNEHIRDRGFNTIVNSLAAALENAHLGFQYMENYKNSREILIREYDDSSELPDEHYQIRMRYYDGAQLQEARKAYDTQMRSFETEILHAADILRVIYEDSKSPFKVSDFKDLALKMKDRIRKLKGKDGGPLYEDVEKPWDGLSFVKTGETEVEQLNRTYAWEKERFSARLSLMREMTQNLYGEFDYPAERRALEEQLNFLEREYNRFACQINPYHLQPGLTLEADVTSIKRKRVTLDAMSGAINEFLQGAIKTFQEAAFPPRSGPSGGGGQSFGDLFSSVSAGTLNLGGPDSADYPDDPDTRPKTPPKKRAPRKTPDPDTTGGDIREI